MKIVKHVFRYFRINDSVSEGIETAAVAARASSTTKQVQEVIEVVDVDV